MANTCLRIPLVISLAGLGWGGALSAEAEAGAGRAGELSVLVTPRADGKLISGLDVELSIKEPRLKAGAKIVQMPILSYDVRTAAYDGKQIMAWDDRGELPLVQHDDPPLSTRVVRNWSVSRTTVGTVRLRYSAGFETADVTTRSGPIFDMRRNGDGLVGNGTYFLALPKSEDRYRLTLRWDLSKVPAGTRAISSLGEGTVTIDDRPEVLTRSFYMIGPVVSDTSPAAPKVSIHWLQTPPSPIAQDLALIPKLHAYMSRFFRDQGREFRLFVRANPYPAGGGQGGPQSFLFSYGTDGRGSNQSISIMDFLAHEMVHVWPRLEGGERWESGWYTEGIADHYSALFPLEAGVTDFNEYLYNLNFQLTSYYTNPYIVTPLKDLDGLMTRDSRAGHEIYLRGFMFLAQQNAKIRERSAGKNGLDDVVLAMLDRQNAGEKLTSADWVATVERYTGADAKRDFDDMMAGKLITLPTDAFGPCVNLAQVSRQRFELGFDQGRLGRITALIPGSAAARAGLLEGDDVLSMTKITWVVAEAGREMVIRVNRAGRPVDIRYGATGPLLDSWVARSSEKAPAGVCATKSVATTAP